MKTSTQLLMVLIISLLGLVSEVKSQELICWATNYFQTATTANDEGYVFRKFIPSKTDRIILGENFLTIQHEVPTAVDDNWRFVAVTDELVLRHTGGGNFVGVSASKIWVVGWGSTNWNATTNPVPIIDGFSLNYEPEKVGESREFDSSGLIRTITKGSSIVYVIHNPYGRTRVIDFSCLGNNGFGFNVRQSIGPESYWGERTYCTVSIAGAILQERQNSRFSSFVVTGISTLDTP